MAPPIETGQRYAADVRELWLGLSQTLSRLETIATAPGSLEADGALETLRRLQYRLHISGESVVGLTPPATDERANSELASALAGARDATADVIDAVELRGLTGIEPVLYTWRGALFRVRLERLRYSTVAKVQPSPEPIPPLHAPITACLLTGLGAVGFCYGATFGPWPLWVAGLLAVAASLLLYRP